MNILLMTDKLITGGAESYFCKLESNLRDENLQFIQLQVMENYMNLLLEKKISCCSRWNHLRNMYYLRREICDRKIEIIHANSLRMVLYSFYFKSL